MEDEGKIKGSFPPLVASQEGHIDVMQALLEAGVDPNQVEAQYSQSSLFQAAAHNQTHARHSPLGAEWRGCEFGELAGPLCIAAHSGHKEAVIALLEAKAAVNQAKNDGSGPVYIAAQNGRADILELLINFDLG